MLELGLGESSSDERLVLRPMEDLEGRVGEWGEDTGGMAGRSEALSAECLLPGCPRFTTMSACIMGSYRCGESCLQLPLRAQEVHHIAPPPLWGSPSKAPGHEFPACPKTTYQGGCSSQIDKVLKAPNTQNRCSEFPNAYPTRFEANSKKLRIYTAGLLGPQINEN